jgi:hypothetical protein
MEPAGAAATAAGTLMVFALLHMETQMVIYKTNAYTTEILRANDNLRRLNTPYRYVNLSTFSMPALHDPLQ